MHPDSEELTRLKAAYALAMLVGICWLLAGLYIGWQTFGWATGALDYPGPGDYASRRPFYGPSYYDAGKIAAICVVVVSLVYLTGNTRAYRRMLRTLTTINNQDAGYAPAGMLAVALLLSLSLCWVFPWWVSKYLV